MRNGSVSDREFILPESGGADETCQGRRTYMGTATYDTGAGTAAYEGGGVWTRGHEGGSRMVSPPEFHYRDQTLTLPVVQLDGDVAAGGSTVELTASAGRTERVDGIVNPLADSSGRVYVTVGSAYYEAWGEFIAERTAGQVVELDHDTETVTVELVVPSPATVDQAIYAAGEGPNAVQIQGMAVDSYNSSEGDGSYSSSTSDNGTVTTGGGINPVEGTVDGDLYTVRQGETVKVSSGGRVNGDVHSQHDVNVQGSGLVEGAIHADEAVTVKGEAGGSVHAGGDVGLPSSGGVVQGDVRTAGTLSFGSSDTSVNGDVHGGGLTGLGSDGRTLGGDVYTDGSYGTEDTSSVVPVFGELHAGRGIYTDGVTVGGDAHTKRDFVDTGSTYEGALHVGADATLTDTTVSNGDVFVGGDLTASGTSEFDGTVYVGGDADLSSTVVHGDLHVDGDLHCSDSTIHGDVYGTVESASGCTFTTAGSPSVVAPTPPDDPGGVTAPSQPVMDPPRIHLPPESAFDDIPEDCSNDGGTIQVGSAGDHCRLPPGTYNASTLDVDNGKLTFEQGGAVELYVAGDVSLSGGNVTTSPDGEHDAERVEINVLGDSTVDLEGVNLTGVINAPHAAVDLDENNGGAHVFGAIIAETVQGDNGAQVHYDESLGGTTVGDGRGDVPTIRYLHVTTNELNVTD